MSIKIKNVDFAYNTKLTLKNIDLTIEDGNFVAFVGPNGSGKSTLIRCLDRILIPQNGSVFINDIDLAKINREEIAKLIAYVPQSEGEKNRITVYESVLMGRKPYIGWRPCKNDHQMVLEVLKMLDLENIAMSYLNELSGGQRQRVFIARALAQEPSILLLDEPTANLDLKHTLEVMDVLKKLSLKQITIVIAIHDLNMAARYCNQIIMLNDGEVFANGGNEILTTKNINRLYDVDVKIINDDDQIIFTPK